jgi:gliding motility-associated-like protein
MKSSNKIACYLILLILGLALPIRADHIVGGHVEMQALGTTPGKYRLILKLYFNELNPTGDVPNYAEYVGISRKKDHADLKVFGLPKTKVVAFEYANEDCAKLNKLKILEVTFEKDVDLDPTQFQDPDGYYLYHDRCCRNSGITNIPTSNIASMAFYTEFPPMIRNGKPFLNSTPSFKVLSGEYVCNKDPFKYNFNATDADGDSLRYILANPLQGKSTASFPDKIQSGPFTNLPWQTGYSLSNVIPGTPTLSVDGRKGFITVTPSQLGLYVFSVICEEYRKINGVYVKIGYSQRDFQLRVIDCPPAVIPDPIITVVGKTGTDPVICFGDKVVFQATKNPNWSYQWELDGDNIPDADYDTLMATRPGIYDLTVSIKNQCTKSRTSRQITLKVLNANVKLKASDKSFCEGGKVNLESPLTGSNFSYKWTQIGQSFTSTQAKVDITKGGKYYLAITDNSNPTACPAVTDTVEVKEFANPSASITSSRANNLICKGETLKLSASTGNKLNYQWFLEGISVPTAQSIDYTISNVGNYTVEVTDSNFCKKVSTVLKIDSVSKKSISIDSIPPICDQNRGVIQLKASPTGGTFDGLGVTDKNQGTFDPKIVGLGEHSVSYQYTGILQCQSGTAQTKITITEPYKLVLSPKEINIWKGTSIALSSPKNTGFKYNWQPDNTLTDAKTYKPIARPLTTQTYTLNLTTDKGCISKDTIKIFVNNKIWIPNIFTPNGDNQNDVWELPGTETYADVEVSIYNRWGEVVFYSKGYNIPFDGKYKGELLPIGSYAYKINVPSKEYLYEGSVLIER